ncbi:hypothetical protein [Streptomyces sp. NRRL S-87]|uniref:hypothetical protein n=1 Tax=Streptomyces sp. NRRL S-87 TaxID=1463920 RepID=UPI00068A47A0|nr:hypothetical protein [Streptomyces sp. NRRL S-87]
MARGAGPSAGGGPDAGPPLDPARVPRTAERAGELVARVLPGPDAFGPGIRPDRPYESEPDRWPVLDRWCDWRSAPLPRDVLATRTRTFRVPGGPGRAEARLTATVTVHPDALDSAWEIARSMEEVMRCPDQQLREGRRLTSLFTSVLDYGEQAGDWAQDAFSETGQYHDGTGGPYPYTWSQGRYGPVTVAVAALGARGVPREALAPYVAQGQARMLHRAQLALGRAGSGRERAEYAPDREGA